MSVGNVSRKSDTLFKPLGSYIHVAYIHRDIHTQIYKFKPLKKLNCIRLAVGSSVLCWESVLKHFKTKHPPKNSHCWVVCCLAWYTAVILNRREIVQKTHEMHWKLRTSVPGVGHQKDQFLSSTAPTTCCTTNAPKDEGRLPSPPLANEILLFQALW